MTKLNIFTDDVIDSLRKDKSQITSELLESLRAQGNDGKQLALEILDIETDNEQYYLDAYGNRISFNGNRRLKKAFTKLPMSKIHEIELKRCAEDIHYFKDNYVKIKTQSGVNFPDLRSYQDEFLNILLPDKHENIAGKMGRQSGKTVSTSIYLSWVYSFRMDLNIGIVANKGAMAREFLANAKNILIELPVWMQQGVASWNKGSIENESNMRMLTDVPNSDSFRGFSISILVIDEAAAIKSTIWDEFMDSIMPSQSGLAWKKNIIISTMRGMNHWFDLTSKAEKRNVINNISKTESIRLVTGEEVTIEEYYERTNSKKSNQDLIPE